jgi:hypothetical protein
MNKIIFNDDLLIRTLIENIPEFEKEIEPEFIFSAYLIYGDFGIFLRDKIFDKVQGRYIVDKSFTFLNMLANEGDQKVSQMLRVTTFEILIDQTATIAIAKEKLKGKAYEVFLETLKLIN